MFKAHMERMTKSIRSLIQPSTPEEGEVPLRIWAKRASITILRTTTSIGLVIKANSVRKIGRKRTTGAEVLAVVIATRSISITSGPKKNCDLEQCRSVDENAMLLYRKVARVLL